MLLKFIFALIIYVELQKNVRSNIFHITSTF